jgi:hypothetical protein
MTSSDDKIPASRSADVEAWNARAFADRSVSALRAAAARVIMAWEHAEIGNEPMIEALVALRDALAAQPSAAPVENTNSGAPTASRGVDAVNATQPVDSPNFHSSADRARPSECALNDMPPGDVLDHEAAYDLFEALRGATAHTWHEIAARHLAYHRLRSAQPQGVQDDSWVLDAAKDLADVLIAKYSKGDVWRNARAQQLVIALEQFRFISPSLTRPDTKP